MKHLLESTLIAAAVAFVPAASVKAAPQQFRHVPTKAEVVSKIMLRDTLPATGKDSLFVRTPEEIIALTDIAPDIPDFNIIAAPWVFKEYRPLDRPRRIAAPSLESSCRELWLKPDTASATTFIPDTTSTSFPKVYNEDEAVVEPGPELLEGETPAWLRNAIDSYNMQEDLKYSMMVAEPSLIEYAYWELPVPPTLPEDDHSFTGFLKRTFVPQVDKAEAVIPENEINKKHWLHVVNGALQFSQAFVSENWYQGGNNHLALLINFLWDVQLNGVYHPKLLFQSTLSYKLGLNSTEEDQYHKYSISQDIFQYNLKFGYKAANNWYYSFTTQFKTQLLNNYPKDSDKRIASFLTPADLNLGIGMTYSKQNKKKTWQLNASIAPLSYNLRTAIDPEVDHNLFNIPQSAHTHSEFGSNAEITFNWKIASMITYKTRLFLFTDYKYGMGDWENTLNFQFNRFFSTQLYANLRYDSSVDKSIAPKWNRWMLKEILSVGLSYTFSTKN